MTHVVKAGAHAALLSGVHSKVDVFLAWAWDHFDSDHAAIAECHGNPQRIAWANDAHATL